MSTMYDIKERLQSGEKIDLGIPVKYPVKRIANGAYATVFKDSEGYIIRIGHCPEDHDLNALSGHVSWMPEIENSVKNDFISVTKRFDIENLEGLPFQVENDQYVHRAYKNIPSPSSYMDTGNMPSHLMRLASNCPDVDLMKYMLKRVSKMMDGYKPTVHIDQYREIAERIYVETLGKTPKNEKRRYQVSQKETFAFYEDGGVYTKECRDYADYKMGASYIGFVDIILKFPEFWPDYKAIVNFYLTFMEDTGLLPLDAGTDNLGYDENGDIVFRDPYFLTEAYPDFRKRIGAYRAAEGLSVPDEWDIHPQRLDIATAYIWMNKDKPEKIASVVPGVGDVDVTTFQSFQDSGILLSGEVKHTVSHLINHRMREKLTGIPVADCSLSFIPDTEQIKEVMETLGYGKDADIIVTPVCIQKVDDISSQLSIQQSDTILRALSHLTRILSRDRQDLNHYIDGILRGELIDIRKIQVHYDFENEVFGENLHENTYFVQAARLFMDFHNLTGTHLHYNNLVLEDDVVKLRAYSISEHAVMVKICEKLNIEQVNEWHIPRIPQEEKVCSL